MLIIFFASVVDFLRAIFDLFFGEACILFL
jgi:hypothetical protein